MKASLLLKAAKAHPSLTPLQQLAPNPSLPGPTAMERPSQVVNKPLPGDRRRLVK